MLPSALTALTVSGPVGTVKGLAALSRLQVASPYESMQLLQLLPDLTNLTSLEVAQMRSDSDDLLQDMQRVFKAVQKVSQLRALLLYGGEAVDGDLDQPPLPGVGTSLHPTLKKLPLLQDLRVECIDFFLQMACKLLL